MAALSFAVRFLGVVAGAVVLVLGGFGLASAYLPDTTVLQPVSGLLQDAVVAANRNGLKLPLDAALTLENWLTRPLLRHTLVPLGLVLIALSLFAFRGDGLPRAAGEAASAKRGRAKKSAKSRGSKETDSAGKGAEAPAEDSSFDELSKLEKKLRKKTRKSATVLGKKGRFAEAAQMLFDVGDFETAGDYFIEAKQYVRAAEIRHDQNRFLESAELYLKAEQFDSAGTIFGQQEEWLKAAECYLKIERNSVAAEMFEKAGEHRRAARCYRETGFLRHAAQSFVKCKEWKHAAQCLDEVFVEEGASGIAEPRKAAEMRKLIMQAGKLYRRAGCLDEAQTILQKGGCPAQAAELALEREQYAKAAELFLDGGEACRAAEALRSMGEHEEAARILGLYHRDQGDVKEAAGFFEEAGDFLAAGDLYRQLEDYTKAGACYKQQSEFSQAAEMFKSAGDLKSAGACYEQANCFSEAAESYAKVGLAEKEAELLAKAGEYLRSGQCYHREGMDDDAITVLQQVDPESADFGPASALLGDIFQAHGQLGLAIKKLKQAVGGAELKRENVDVYYTLARVYDANEEARKAVDLYEKIMAFDYHFKDVEQRLLQAREVVKNLPPITEPSATNASGTVRQSSASGQPGRYQVVGELGRGGMGIVYKAKDTVLDRIVAYKVLPDALNENPQALKNFLREAKAAASLNHPNIVTVYDCGEQDGRYYIAMEYVDGTTLKEIIRRRGMIAPAGIFHVIVQVCGALSYAHEKKIVHRDIKTANAMWTRDKKAKIMDFGLARVMEEVRNQTTVVAGTPYYMSPEQTLGKNVDHRADIYSLGASIFEMATGSVPFKEGNIPYHHVHTAPPDIRELRSDAPENLAQIVNRCLMKDPAQRYQSTREIIAEIRSSLSGSNG